jgi:hypothetical protein
MQLPGAIGNTYHPPGGPLDGATLEWCRNRPDGVPRLPLPEVGEVVGFRAKPSGPVVAARVHSVESITDPWAHERDAFEPHGPDVNVWRVVVNAARIPQYDLTRPGSYRFELTGDPWPSIVVCVEPDAATGKGARTYVVTREARLAGSVGWTHPSQIGR